MNSKLNKEEIQHSNVWSKIRKILKEKGIKAKDKILYKEKIGFKLIDDNKLLLNELLVWIDQYNNYRLRMPLFYKYSKDYKDIFKSILNKTSKIKNKVQINKDVFTDVLGDYLYENTDEYSYKEILKILTYDEVFNEKEYKEVTYIPFQLNLDYEKYFRNIDYMQNAIKQENEYLLNQNNILKDLLDKMTDLCGTENFLSKEALENLNKYLDKYLETIVSNLSKFYEKNKDNYSNNEEKNYNNNYLFDNL